MKNTGPANSTENNEKVDEREDLDIGFINRGTNNNATNFGKDLTDFLGDEDAF